MARDILQENIDSASRDIAAFNTTIATSHFTHSYAYEDRLAELQDGLKYISQCNEQKRFSKDDDTLQRHLAQIPVAIAAVTTEINRDGDQHMHEYSERTVKLRHAERAEFAKDMKVISDKLGQVTASVQNMLKFSGKEGPTMAL